MADDFLDAIGVKDPAAAPKTALPRVAYSDPTDAAVRTVLAESSGDPDESKWIAGVIANRAKKSQKALDEVVQEPGQFEPWSTAEGRRKMAAVDPKSPDYLSLRADLEPIFAGKSDPSNGATRFYAPQAQADLAAKDGRPVKPEWDDGSGVDVGKTRFFREGAEPGDDFLSAVGVDKAKAEAAQPDDSKGVVAFTGLKEHASKPDSAAYLQLVKGGLIDKDAPEGSEKNPYGIQPGMTEKDVPPGAFYIAGGKLQRAPGGAKESSAVAGLGQGVGDVLTGISHVMPGSDDSDIKNALIGSQMVYGAKYGGDLKSGAGRFTGQLLGSAPLLAGAEAALTPALTRMGAGPVAEFIAGRGGMSMAKGLPRLAVRDASLSTAGALGGGSAAALSASANPEPLGEQVAGGAEGGAVLGPLAPGARAAGRWLGSTARSLVEPLTEGGQNKIVNRLVSSFGPATPDTRVLVPGSEPTLGEASGNAGIATLERNARAHPKLADRFAERQAQNDTARAEFFDKLKGDEDSLQALHDARDAATSGKREAALGGQSKPADIQPVLDTIDGILKGPEGKRTEVVKALNEIRQNLHDAKGEPETDAAMLYGVRKSIDDLLSPKASSEKRGAQLAASQLMDVKKALDTSIQDVAPGFKEYLADYAKLSKPIDEQQFLQSLRLTDKNQNLTLARVQSALDRIDTMRRAKGVNPAKSLAPDTLEQLRNLRDDLKRAGNIDLGKARGSDTQQNIVTGRIAEQGNVPLAAGAVAALMHHPLVAPAVGVGKVVYGGKNAEVLDKLANRLLSPEAAPITVKAAKPPGKIAGAAGKLAKPLLPAAGGLIANRLVTQ